MSEVEKIKIDYERELKWATSIVMLDEEMMECIVCGCQVEGYTNGLYKKFICENGHEMSIVTTHRNN